MSVSQGGHRHILVTGFEPFGTDTLNPSQEVAKAMDGRRFGGVVTRALVLPVEHEAARASVVATLDEPGLEAVLHLGLAAGRARIALEQVAVNVMDYPIPDARGRTLSGERCVPGGFPAYLSTLPLQAILTELTAEGIPAYLSYTAGTYLCNYTLYTTLHVLAERGLAVPAGFVHLPLLPSMVTAHGAEEPSMDVGLMLRAVEIALRVITAD